MKVTAVIFDMDGTVLNTLEDLTDAVNAMRRHFDLEPHSIEQVRHNVGNGVEVLMEKSLPGGRDGQIQLDCLSDRQRLRHGCHAFFEIRKIFCSKKYFTILS